MFFKKKKCNTKTSNTTTTSNTSSTANDAALDGKLTFKNNAPFANCISKINGVLIDNAEDLDVAVPM